MGIIKKEADATSSKKEKEAEIKNFKAELVHLGADPKTGKITVEEYFAKSKDDSKEYLCKFNSANNCQLIGEDKNSFMLTEKKLREGFTIEKRKRIVEPLS